MAVEWPVLTWGDLATLEYGKGIRGYDSPSGRYRVFGTNGPIGWYDQALYDSPSVIIGRKGAYRGVHYSSDAFFVIDTAFYLKPKTRIDLKWAYYELLTQDINGMDSGSAIPSTSRDSFYHLPVVVPSLAEQHAIARVLGALDDKIELNRRMNETLEALARALFQSWFVDFDPVRAKSQGRTPQGMDAETAALFPGSFEASELGEIPAGWRLGKLGEVMNSPRRGVDPTSVDGDTPYIGLEHMPRGSIALSEWGKADDVTSTKMGFQQGEILFGKLRPYFHKVGVAPVDGVASSDIIVITSEPDWLGFVLGYVSSTAFVEYTNGASTGTQMPRASWSDMSKYPIALPPQSVAKIYSQIINPMVQHIHANIIQSSSLAAIRDALLPKLLSGEVRAATVEEGMETAA